MWDDEKIASYTRGFLRVRAHPSATQSITGDITDADFIGSRHWMTRFCDQETYLEASNARAKLMALPDQHRDILLFLADGGSPIEYAKEKNITPWLALSLIKEARDFFSRI